MLTPLDVPLIQFVDKCVDQGDGIIPAQASTQQYFTVVEKGWNRADIPCQITRYSLPTWNKFAPILVMIGNH